MLQAPGFEVISSKLKRRNDLTCLGTGFLNPRGIGFICETIWPTFINMSSKIVFGRKGGQFNKVGFFGMLTNLWASKNLPLTEKKMRTNSVIIFKGRHEYNNTKCHTRCSNNVLALKSDSTHHFFRNACTKSGSLRFSQFSGCWLIFSVYIIMIFDFPFVRLFGVR